MKYLKSFDTHIDYETFTASTEFKRRNVSICKEENHKHYNPFLKQHLVFNDPLLTTVDVNSSITNTATSDVEGSLITYESSNEEIATVDNNGRVNGLIGGTVTITAKANRHGDYAAAKASYELAVNKVNQTLTFEPSTGVVSTEETLEIEAVNDKSDGGAVTYVSSDESIATVHFIDAKTIVSGVAEGEATITATAAETPKYYEATADYELSVLPASKKQYLTFKAITNSNICASRAGLSYSKNGGQSWSSMGTSPIGVSAGQELMVKGNVTGSLSFGSYNTTGTYEVYGNPMSTRNAEGFRGVVSVPANAFDSMFLNCSGLTKIDNIYLGFDTMGSGACLNMFRQCSKITSVPKNLLPSKNLGNVAYGGMFAYCTKLTKAPELPATELTNECYVSMFEGCSSLTEAPQLPAMTLKKGCYRLMFAGCTSLRQAPEIPATGMSISGCAHMFSGCTSLQTAPTILPATELKQYCYFYMFIGCTSLQRAPELPATNINVELCYSSMFYGCSKLNYVKCTGLNPTPGPNEWDGPQGSWLYNVAASGTFVKKAGVNWQRNKSGIPAGWTVQEV